VPHHGNHEAVRRLDGDADVSATVAMQDIAAVVETSVHLWKFAQGHDQRAHEERQDGQPWPAGLPGLVDVRAERLEIRDVHLLDVGEVRDSPHRILHALGDPAPEPDDFDLLDGRIRRQTLHGRLRLHAARQIGIHVRAQDPPRRSASAHEAQIDSVVAGVGTHGGSSNRPVG
jgi:hypothetical protein